MSRPSPGIHWRVAVLSFCLPLLLGACAGLQGRLSPPGPAPARPEPAAAAAAEAFSAERALAHVRALAGLGPRPSGSPAAQAAREYLVSRLEAAGLDVQAVDLTIKPTADGADAASHTLRHLVGRTSGAGADRVMLLAHYDSRGGSPGANDGASGAAVLLELARQLAARPLPYPTEFWFLDGEAGEHPARPDLPPLSGSTALARARVDEFPDVRLAVVFRQVCDADLAIARDRFSNTAHREVFFASARRMGHGAAFPRDRAFVEVLSSHRPLWALGLISVVSIMDPWYGGDEIPGTHWGGAEDTAERCAAESLGVVGEVSLAALRQIAARLEKVDRLSGRAERRAEEALAPPAVEGEAIPDLDPPPPEPDSRPSGADGGGDESS